MWVNVTSHTNFEAAVEKCFELWGSLDVIVNNAGINGEVNWEAQVRITFDVSYYVRFISLCLI